MTALIDLGELPPVLADGPASATLPRWRPRPRHLVLGVVALLVAVCGPAGVPRAPIARAFSIAAPPSSQLVIGHGRAYVADTEGLTQAVSAYDLADGARLWTRPIKLTRAVAWSLSLSGHSLMLSGYVEYDDSVFFAIDADTGEVRWRSGGNLTAVVEHLGAFLMSDIGETRLRLVDERDGLERWTTAVGSRCEYQLDRDDDPSFVVEMCIHDHTVRILDIENGNSIFTRDFADLGLPESLQFIADGQFPTQYAVANGMLVVAYSDPDAPGATLVGLRLGTGGPVSWRVPMPEPVVSVSSCGTYVCEFGGEMIWTVDARTGATVWAGRSVADFSPGARRPLDVSGSELTAPPAAVLIARADYFDQTGEDSPVTIAPDGLSLTAPAYNGGFHTYVYVAVPDRAASGGYRFRIVGAVDGIFAVHCSATARFLVCPTAPGTLTFFTLPPEVAEEAG